MWVPYSLSPVYSGVESGWAGGRLASPPHSLVFALLVSALLASVLSLCLSGPVEPAASACLPAVGLGIDT